MSHLSLAIFAFIFSCQVYGATSEVLASQPPPANTTQQVKAESSAQTTAIQTTHGSWEPKDIVLAAGVVVTLVGEPVGR